MAEPSLAAQLPELVCLRFEVADGSWRRGRARYEVVQVTGLAEEADAIDAAYRLGGLDAVRGYVSGGKS